MIQLMIPRIREIAFHCYLMSLGNFRWIRILGRDIMKMRFMLWNIFILLAFFLLSLQAKERLKIDLSLSDEKL